MYRQLDLADASAIVQHYLALPPHDRSLRFGVAKSDEAVTRYCAAIDWRRSRLIGYFARRRLRGLLELSPPLSGPSRAREVAVVVAPDWRRRGIGKGLVRAALAAAEQGCCDRLLFFWQPSNDGFPRFLAACGGFADATRGLGWIEVTTSPQPDAIVTRRGFGPSRLGAIAAL
jgi:GNAT superfamily N-acetyltransferase